MQPAFICGFANFVVKLLWAFGAVAFHLVTTAVANSRGLQVLGPRALEKSREVNLQPVLARANSSDLRGVDSGLAKCSKEDGFGAASFAFPDPRFVDTR